MKRKKPNDDPADHFLEPKQTTPQTAKGSGIERRLGAWGSHAKTMSKPTLESTFDEDRLSSVISAEKQFPIDALPDRFRQPVEALMAFFGIDPVLPVMSVLGISSTALGAGLQVHSNKAITRGNLYQIVGAESGTCKTLVQNLLQEPLNEIQNELATRHEREERPRIQAEEKLLDLQIKELIKSAKEDKSTGLQSQLARLIAKDATLEDRGATGIWSADTTSQALGLLLADNNEQIAIMTAEGSLVLHKLLGISTADAQLLCAGFSGDSHAVDRISRPSLILKSPCVSLFLATQPDVLYRAFSSERLRLGGFLARCMAVDTRIRVHHEDPDKPMRINADVTGAWKAHIRTLFETFHQSAIPYTLMVQPAVYDASREFYNASVDLLSESCDIKPFIVRWNEQAWRVAIHLHAAKHGADSVEYGLALDTFEAAVRVIKFLASEQLKILQRARIERDRKDLNRLIHLIANEPVTLRDMDRRHGFAEGRLMDMAKRHSELRIYELKHPRGGRPSMVIGMSKPA
jgi:hypothetical protein